MNTVLITGVSRGIGLALAKVFLEKGYFVIGTSTSGGSPISSENLLTLKLELSATDSIDECVKQILSQNRKIDILINNAGGLFDVEETKVVIEKLKKSLDVNLIGVIDFTEKVLQQIPQGGHIVNISSSSGSLGNTKHMNWPSYAISKAALNMYTRKLAYRLQEDDITVSAAYPGHVKTDMGGDRGVIDPDEAAEHIFMLATTKVESGQFWYQGEKFPW